jgi:4-carboxymuconolactone decarboxylase
MKPSKIIITAWTSVCFALLSNNLNAQNMTTHLDKRQEKNDAKTNESIFPKGGKGSADWFTGAVWLQPLINPSDMENLYSIGSVTFEAGGRTHWHTHPIGQVLLVTDGKGWYQERGKPAQALIKGSVVTIPKDVEHWHGAAHDSRFVHIAITNMKDKNNVTWMSPVTDEEYHN